MSDSYSLNVDITPNQDTAFLVSMTVTKVSEKYRVSGTIDVAIPELTQSALLEAVSKIITVGKAF